MVLVALSYLVGQRVLGASFRRASMLCLRILLPWPDHIPETLPLLSSNLWLGFNIQMRGTHSDSSASVSLGAQYFCFVFQFCPEFIVGICKRTAPLRDYTSSGKQEHLIIFASLSLNNVWDTVWAHRKHFVLIELNTRVLLKSTNPLKERQEKTLFSQLILDFL